MSENRIPPAGAHLVLTLVLLAVCGCASTEHTAGRPIPQEKVDRIVKGTTTKDQIIEWFGAPTSQTEMGGDVLYTYTYSVTTGSAWSVGYYTSGSDKQQADELTITFDKASGRVKTYSIQRGIDRA